MEGRVPRQNCPSQTNNHSIMKTLKLLGLIAIASFAVCQHHAFAATKTYQVTGKVLEVSDKMIVVQKGDERWEIAREASTKLTGVVKVGEKVTIHYRMTAVSVESKLANGEMPTGDKARPTAVSAKKEKTS
jgi:hypothetical protein